MDQAAIAEGYALLERARNLMRVQLAEEAEAVLREASGRFQGRELSELLALALLMQGRLRDGFREFEARKARRDLLDRKLSTPEWDGPLAGRAIMVWGEQGLGDEIQGARFLPMLRQLGARHITLACSRLMQRALQPFADVVVDREAAQMVVPKHDCWVRMWSIPHRLGLELSDLSGAPYMSAPPTELGGIGLVEHGNPRNPIDAQRSIPDGLLQQAVPQGSLLQPEGDVRDSPGRIAGLDLLITVDTSWAHMAGAMGVPCWVLLPFKGLDWRWLRDRSDSPWYDSLRLYRQTAPGDWGGLLDRVRADLADWRPVGRTFANT
jgi:hypothetical protein